MSIPRVSMIVPHYNDLTGLARCLDGLAAQKLEADTFEIVVADNASPVGEAAVAEAIAGRAKLVIAREQGAGPARNAGVAAASAPLLAFVDSDCLPRPDWLAAGLAALAHHDIVGGRVTVLVESARMSGVEAFETVFAFNMRNYVEKKGFAGTGNLFCSRETFDAVGPFRSGVAEDVEWSHRATGKGFSLGYAEAAIVAHPARRDWNDLLRKWRRTNRERYELACTRRGGRARWLAQTLLLPASIAAHAPRLFIDPALPDAGTRLRGLGTLVRHRLWRVGDQLGLFFRGSPH